MRSGDFPVRSCASRVRVCRGSVRSDSSMSSGRVCVILLLHLSFRWFSTIEVCMSVSPALASSGVQFGIRGRLWVKLRW